MKERKKEMLENSSIFNAFSIIMLNQPCAVVFTNSSALLRDVLFVKAKKMLLLLVEGSDIHKQKQTFL
jgi:hypothetical protein